jgi:hypothetical protein
LPLKLNTPKADITIAERSAAQALHMPAWIERRYCRQNLNRIL